MKNDKREEKMDKEKKTLAKLLIVRIKIQYK
ncbi:MAG: hypothetical protein MRECE_2c081 [Mycoplasmataceae bacterium CE_OT135]|nr:MAG: hypothetical protein MRECE_2c081 [Mycoplasmataceae bacterium CE_OT135]